MKKIIVFVVILLCMGVGVVLAKNINDKPVYTVNKSNHEAIYSFFIQNMINDKGGVLTNLKDVENAGEITKGHYVLSESQGLLMEYAVLTKNKDLYLQSLNFAKEYMYNDDGSFVWRVTSQGERESSVNATIDDLHIYLQLINAKKVWNDMNNSIYLAKFEQKNYSYDNFLINGYDNLSQQKLLNLDSCYVHLSSLKNLLEHDKISKTFYNDNLNVIKGMKISKKFPLKYKTFFINPQMIEKREKINMIEALLAERNLAQVGEMSSDVLKWLNNNIENNIFAYYNIDGTAASDMQSSAVYAIIAQIAYYSNDAILYDKAMKKGEVLLLNAISNPDNNEITSYDNLQMLVAFALADRKE